MHKKGFSSLTDKYINIHIEEVKTIQKNKKPIEERTKDLGEKITSLGCLLTVVLTVPIILTVLLGPLGLFISAGVVGLFVIGKINQKKEK